MDEYAAMPLLYFTYMNRFDVEALNITDDEIMAAVEEQLAIQGRGEAVIEPRMHLEPGVARGHFNVLRGSLGSEVDSAGAVTAIGPKHLAPKGAKVLGTSAPAARPTGRCG